MNCTLIISLFHISVKLFIDLHFNGGRRQRTELTILHKYGNLNPLEGKVNKVQEFRRANQFALFMLAVMILGSSLVAGIMNWTGSQDMLTRYVLTYGIQFVCPLILYCAVCNERRPSDILRVRRPAWYTFFLTAVIAVAVQPALMCLSSLTSLIFHNYLTASLERYTQQPLWVTLFAAALIPAFCEEFVCRGAYLSGCRRLGIYYAAALNGIFFGVLHLNPQQGIYAAVFGFLCALIAIGADSVWPAVLAHFMINGMQIALAYLTDRFASSDQWLGAVMRETSEPGAVWKALPAAVLLLCVAVWCLVRIFYINNRRELLGGKLAEGWPKERVQPLRGGELFSGLYWFIGMVVLFGAVCLIVGIS